MQQPPVRPEEHPMMDLPQAANMLIFNDDGLVLAVARKDNHSQFSLPGGKVEDDETLIQGAIREAKEETGVGCVKAEPFFTKTCVGRADGSRPGKIYLATTFICTEWYGKPSAVEGAPVKWVNPEELYAPGQPYPEYNRALFTYLRDVREHQRSETTKAD